MGKSAFYFDHDYNARNDQKVLTLRSEYGWHGYGVFFGIVESLCESDGTIKRGALGGLSLGLNMAKAELIKLIDFMIEIDLLKENEDGIYSERVNDHLAYRSMLSEAGKRGGRGNKKHPFSHAKAPLEAGKESIEDNSKEDDSKLKKNKFIKPSLLEIESYCIERKNNIDHNKFFNYYESNGWKVGRNPMKDWKAAVHTWENNNSNSGNTIQPGRNGFEPKYPILGKKTNIEILMDTYEGVNKLMDERDKLEENG